MFLIYINDIKNSTPLNVLCFADDTTISYHCPNIIQLYNTMNTELIQINDNKLCLDVKKTKYIIFSPSSNSNIVNHSLNIDNQNIDKMEMT